MESLNIKRVLTIFEPSVSGKQTGGVHDYPVVSPRTSLLELPLLLSFCIKVALTTKLLFTQLEHHSRQCMVTVLQYPRGYN